MTKATTSKFPVIGLVTGLFFGVWSLAKGRIGRGIMEISGGMASCFPGIGTATSGALDIPIFLDQVEEELEKEL